MTQAQINHYRALWAAARRVLRGQGLSSTACEERRHEIHRQVLGKRVSSTQLTNRQFDLVKGAFLAISEPDNLRAQERAVDGNRIRRRHVIDTLCKKLGYGEASLQTTIDQMQRAGRLREPDRPHSAGEAEAFDIERGRDSIPRLYLDDLREEELETVIIALRLQVGRTAKQREAERIAPTFTF